MPYIGGKKPYTQFIISAAWSLAMYRLLKARGEALETETINLKQMQTGGNDDR